MKKSISGIAVTAVLYSAGVVAQINASTTVSWDVTATKDTTSVLVVTPVRPLAFQYVEGLDQFNTQNGAFDITIQGQSGATDFKLLSQLVTNTLRRADGSTLEVGVGWKGQKLTKTSQTTLVDTAGAESAGLDSLAVASAYASSDRRSAQGNFDFTIDSATSDGVTTQRFKNLRDGLWSGEVKVQFIAVWVTP
ncbi:common pilus major fimbrillin subunit EcpA [Entomohabitans teleogrylli]|uniref:common pilus major fimbrillin subunit EcpA n=1 Tax=Entomohabitans teleogrylli TaxID=1384589 RepID=UPI00073D379C|nr:common pilus major fimbrillin subunit EcpA [Entomohabitans teleogrylli]